MVVDSWLHSTAVVALVEQWSNDPHECTINIMSHSEPGGGPMVQSPSSYYRADGVIWP